MNQSNEPITSREYKLMLQVDRFQDREAGSKAFWNLVEFLVKKQGGQVEDKQNKQKHEETRKTWYLDTNGSSLRQQGFVLRVRSEGDEKEKYKITLKYRSPDRYLSASQNMSTSAEGKTKTKFEEDIIPQFTSKFSHSTSVYADKLPDLGDLKKVANLFPGLKKMPFDEGMEVTIVNGFKAREIFRKVAKLKFEEEPIVKAGLNFWYLLGEADEIPLVGEFSFDYGLLKNGINEKDKLEQFPVPVVAGANNLFQALQKQVGWINFNATTKTAYAYDGF